MAKFWRDGEGHGPLVPRHDTEVRVDSEELSFEVAPSLDRAEVTATYSMTNGGAAASDAEVAFVVVAAEGLGDDRLEEPRVALTVDGEPLAFRVVTDAELLKPALEAWLAKQAEPDPEIAGLLAPTKGDGEAIVRAAERVIPAQVTKLHDGWSMLASTRRLTWLTFKLAFAAGATRKVKVRYTHVAGSDARRAVNPTFTYDYLLSPARRWARFGRLELAVHMPPRTELESSLALTRDGDTYRASFDGLPNQELSLFAMSTRGLLFGMTRPTGYWSLLAACLALVVVPLSWRLGRAWARLARSKVGMWLLCVFGTGALVSVASVLVEWLVSAAVPAAAFGVGYGPAFGLLLFVIVSAMVGVGISGVTARRRAA